MENYSKNLIAVVEMLLAVQVPNSEDLVIVEANGVLDLADFNLNPIEIEKFQRIIRKLNFHLAVSLQEQHPASSVISEIRPKLSD